METKNATRPDWGKLFDQALNEPGRLSECYSLFHRYSLGNQALAMSQMLERGIPIGPIASFNGWKNVGRKIKKGEKAIALWMPIAKTEEVERPDGTKEQVTKRFFVMKNNWFALDQTEPVEPDAEVIDVVAAAPGWDKAKALKSLGIEEVPFDEINGNVQGFARPGAQQVAISPLAQNPLKTLFHEIAHCLLHGKEGEVFVDGGGISRAIQEAEAEAVAYLCCASLGLPGLDESRGYIQDWLGSSELAEEFRKKSATRVFAAADKILKGGSIEEDGDD